MNYEAVFKILIFLGFAGFFYTVIQSGAVRLYVHARIFPYLEFAVGAFVLMAFFTLGEVFQRAPRKTPAGRYTLFFVTLILAVSLPAAVAVPNTMYLGDGVQGQNTESREKENGATDPSREAGNQQETLAPTGEEENTPAGEPGNEEWGLSLQDGKIIMDDNTFAGWLNEIYERLDVYVGVEIETSGFVFHSEEFLQDQFVPARMMMNCCAADAVPVGFLCGYPQAAHLPDDSWVKVTGMITRTTYEGETIPLIQAKKIVPVEKPETEYIYPME